MADGLVYSILIGSWITVVIFDLLLLQLFELDNVVTLDCVRLLKYDDSYENVECSFEGHEATPMGELLGGVKPTYFFDLFLETKLPSQTFEPIKAGGKLLTDADGY